MKVEAEVLDRADYVIASSTGVASHLRSQGRSDVVLWENVADTDLFSQSQRYPRLRRAIFAGNLTPDKVDFALLEQVASRGVPLTLAGPIGIDGTNNRPLERILSHSSVSYLGRLPLDQFATEAGKSCVGLIPYHLNALTAGVFPLKTYEYLAAGLSVVSTDLPSLRGKKIEGLQIATTDSFGGLVKTEIEAFTKEKARLRADRATPYSWTSRLAQARMLLEW